MSFSEKLKEARIAKGYTQQQIAEMMEITNSTYCGYETGKRQPDVPKIKQLAKLLNISGDVLLETGFADNKKAPDPVITEPEASEEEEVKKIYTVLRSSLLSGGLLKEGEKLTEKQARILINIAGLLSEAFD